MVIGKLKYLIGTARGATWYPLCRSRIYFFSRHTGTESAYSVVEEGIPDPRTGKKGEK